MSIEQPTNRYSVIREKNPREILLLRGSGCKWRRCTFCDYHLDFSRDEDANFLLNQKELAKVTGCFHRLEVINSGSFCDLDDKTLHLIRQVCEEKEIRELHFECHWMHRDEIKAAKDFFAEKDICLKIKMGVETFDPQFRETVLRKGFTADSPQEIAEYAHEVCLLFGLTGQTLASMKRDIETGLAFFERICINIMVANSTKMKPDRDVIRIFAENLYPLYIGNERVDILMENTEFGVGDKYEQ